MGGETIDIASGELAIRASSKTGERLWLVSAENADATLSGTSTTGSLRNVRVEVFENDRESITITAPEAQQTPKGYELSGGVVAKAIDEKFSLRASRLSGSPESDRLLISGEVSADLQDAFLSRADSATALLKSNKKMISSTLPTLVLLALTVQGQDVNLVDKAKDLHISGATEFSIRGLDETDLSFRGTGRPIQAEWKKTGLSVSAQSVSGTLLRGETYLLKEMKASGGVQVVITEEDGRISVSSSSADFNRASRRLELSGQVRGSSTSARLPGRFAASRVIVIFSAAGLSSGTYDVEKLVAYGPGITYDTNLEAGDLSAKGIDELQLTPVEDGHRFVASGDSTAVDFVPADRKKAASWAAAAGKISGRVSKSGELLTLEASDQVKMLVTGTTNEKVWEMTVRSPFLNYDRTKSLLSVHGGVTATGTHPAFAGGGATMSADRGEVQFQPGTLIPTEVRLFGGRNR